MPTALPLFYQVHFYLFGLLAIASALAFVTRKSPVSAALWLVSVVFNLAALYVMMAAHFIGAIQVLVYAGAIMVVFLFVVMLLNLGRPGELSDIRGKWGRLAAGLIGLAGLGVFYIVLIRAWQRAGERDKTRAFPFALAALAWLFPLNTHTAFYSSQWSQLVWLLLALYCASLLRAPAGAAVTA